MPSASAFTSYLEFAAAKAAAPAGRRPAARSPAWATSAHTLFVKAAWHHGCQRTPLSMPRWPGSGGTERGRTRPTRPSCASWPDPSVRSPSTRADQHTDRSDVWGTMGRSAIGLCAIRRGHTWYQKARSPRRTSQNALPIAQIPDWRSPRPSGSTPREAVGNRA